MSIEQYLDEQEAADLPREIPTTPGVFILQYPYQNTICILDPRCPVRYVNDARGVTGAKNNVKFFMNTNVLELMLNSALGLQTLLQGQMTRDCEEKDEMYLEYGEPFWAPQEAYMPRRIIGLTAEVNTVNEQQEEEEIYRTKAMDTIYDESEQQDTPVEEPTLSVESKTPLSKPKKVVKAVSVDLDLTEEGEDVQETDEDVTAEEEANSKRKRKAGVLLDTIASTNRSKDVKAKKSTKSRVPSPKAAEFDEQEPYREDTPEQPTKPRKSRFLHFFCAIFRVDYALFLTYCLIERLQTPSRKPCSNFF